MTKNQTKLNWAVTQLKANLVMIFVSRKNPEFWIQKRSSGDSGANKFTLESKQRCGSQGEGGIGQIIQN